MAHHAWGESTWSFKDGDEIGPKMMARLARDWHFTREDLQAKYKLDDTEVKLN
jgi:hypothetical protein